MSVKGGRANELTSTTSLFRTILSNKITSELFRLNSSSRILKKNDISEMALGNPKNLTVYLIATNGIVGLCCK